MKISDVQVSDGPLVLVKTTEVDDFELRFWIKFPRGYREYVTELGEGVLGGTFVRIYPPWRIEKELAGWRRRINKYWFWEVDDGLLPKDRALECIIVGDTLNGDELVFHPMRPTSLFVLPRDSEQVFIAGNDIMTAIDWMCSSGELAEPFTERIFEPFDSRKEDAERQVNIEKVSDPEGESLDELVDLQRRWEERHSAHKLAQKDLKKEHGKDKKSTFLYEAFVMKGKFPYEPGYLIVYSIEEKEGGRELGIFSWHMNEDSRGYSYSPVQKRYP